MSVIDAGFSLSISVLDQTAITKYHRAVAYIQWNLFLTVLEMECQQILCPVKVSFQVTDSQLLVVSSK